MKKFWFLLLFLIGLIVVGTPVYAQGLLTLSLQTPREPVAPGQKVELVLSCAADGEQQLATYRAKVSFDPSKLEFKGLRGLGNSADADYQYRRQGDRIVIVYLSETAGQSLTEEACPLFALDFVVASAAQEGETSVTAVLDGAGNPEVQRLTVAGDAQGSLHIKNPEPPDCALIALQPDVGSLSPAFEPDILRYTMEVPYSVDRVTLYAQARDPQASVRVNRKTLEKMGSDTELQTTVTGIDGKTKQTYTVTVHRGEKPAAVSQSGGGGASSRKPVTVQSGTVTSKGTSSKTQSAQSMDGNSSSAADIDVSSKIGGASQKGAVSAVYGDVISTRGDRFPAFLVGFVLCAGAIALMLVLFRRSGKHFH